MMLTNDLRPYGTLRLCFSTSYVLLSDNIQAAIISLAGKWKRFVDHNVVTDLLLPGPAVG